MSQETKQQKQDRINMLNDNLSQSKKRLDLGEITPTYYNELKRDVKDRIKEIKLGGNF